MKNIMKSVELEMKLKQMDKEIEKALLDTDIQLAFVEVKYAGDKLRDMELIDELHLTMSMLVKLVNRLKDIELQAIKIEDMELYFKCEKKIIRIVDVMEYIRNTYMF